MLKFQLHNGNGRTLGFSLGCPIQTLRDAYYLGGEKILGGVVPQIHYPPYILVGPNTICINPTKMCGE